MREICMSGSTRGRAATHMDAPSLLYWFFPPMSRPLRAGFEGVFCPPGRCPGMLARNGGGMSRPFGAPLCAHLR
jgi:hypothetical protein